MKFRVHQNLHHIQIQLLQSSRETRKIDKKMREEIIPEMMRNVNIMRNMKFGFEETDETTVIRTGNRLSNNQDWETKYEK